MVLPRVVCGISGGVDSAVAALLLKQKGYDVHGVFMRNWDIRDEVGHCSSDEDYEYSSRVCQALRIPFSEVNLVKEYWTNVFEPSVAEYERGHTPNPDILCNHYVKFDALLKKCAKFFGNEHLVLATGHYAQTSMGEDILHKHECDKIKTDNRLLTSTDSWKDQTFFLSQITQQALRRTYFPIGHLLKQDVKKIAKLSPVSFTLQRKESMGICFIGKRDFSNFIKDYLPPKPGRFVCYETGKTLGHHEGCHIYTVGQRSKLSGFGDCYIILHKDLETADMLVVPGTNHPSLYSRSMIVDKPHWIRNVENLEAFHCQFRFMHQADLVNCTVHALDDDSYLVILDEPRRALTVGQFAVFYLNNECLGGARINDVGPSMHECQSRDQVELATYRRNLSFWNELINRYSELTVYEYNEIVGYNLFKRARS